MSAEAEHVRELFAALGPVRIRRMFGGLGVFQGDVMFALVVDGIIFLKASEPLAAEMAAEGARQFTYTRAGRLISVGYWSLPDSALDDEEEAARWARASLGAATAQARRK